MKKSLFIIPLLFISLSFNFINTYSTKEINKNIGIYCRSCGKLVNVVDDIKLSNYTVPSYVKRGDLLISISTGGKSPSLSSKIKKELEEKYDDSYEEYINILGEIRQKVIKNYKNISERKKVLKDLVNLDLEELKTLENKF